MLVHDLFLDLVRVEIALSLKIWPVADRNSSFRDSSLTSTIIVLHQQHQHNMKPFFGTLT